MHTHVDNTHTRAHPPQSLCLSRTPPCQPTHTHTHTPSLTPAACTASLAAGAAAFLLVALPYEFLVQALLPPPPGRRSLANFDLGRGTAWRGGRSASTGSQVKSPSLLKGHQQASRGCRRPMCPPVCKLCACLSLCPLSIPGVASWPVYISRGPPRPLQDRFPPPSVFISTSPRSSVQKSLKANDNPVSHSLTRRTTSLSTLAPRQQQQQQHHQGEAGHTASSITREPTRPRALLDQPAASLCRL